MIRKLSIVFLLACTFASFGQLFMINSASAQDVYVYTTYENGIRLRHHVRTESIRQVDGCIEAMVVHEYNGYVIRFENTEGTWYYSISIKGKFENWSEVASNKHANDVLYVVLQYI